MPEIPVRDCGAPVERKLQSSAARRLTRALSVVLIFIVLMLPGSLHTQSSVPLYLDPQQPIERRVDDLMSRMTLKEKVGQLNLPCVYVEQLGKTIDEKMEACKKFAAGTYTQEIGPGCGFFTLANTSLRQGPRQHVG